MFVQSSQGFFEQDEIKTVCVKAELKESILTYLRKYHGIYTQTIYNDLQGYIKHQKIHQKAYSKYGRGKLSDFGHIVRIDDKAFSQPAIKHYSKAIELKRITLVLMIILT